MKDSWKIVTKDLGMEFTSNGKTGRITTENGRDSVVVLHNINLQVKDSEFVCIVGPSGCGKSTLLNIIGGFLKATRGELLIDGKAVTGPDVKRIFIFQENGIFPWLTVQGNVGFGILNKTEREKREMTSSYIELVGLAGFEHAYPREISGGMKQRVEIARALAANPDVLLMDEPFGALDFITRLNMRSELVRIWQGERKTVLFVTHDVEESVQLADRVVVMGKPPSTITTILDVKLPRPRDLDAPEYLCIRDEIFEIMGLDRSVRDQRDPGQKSAGLEEVARLGSDRKHLIGPRPLRKLDADVIIIGGGPAGSSLGIYLSQRGVDHLIIDTAHHPRAHVGGSLSYFTSALLKEMGLLTAMERERFIVKGGVSWTSWRDEGQIDTHFRWLGEPGHAYQVDRAEFDDLLLRRARELGSRVFSGASVDRVDFSRRDQAVGVTVRIGGARVSLKGRLVVDASGGQAVLGRQLDLLRPSSGLPQLAVHSYFRDFDRGPTETAGYTHIHLLPLKRAWAWQVPLRNEITSIGVVTERGDYVQSGQNVEEFFNLTVSLNSTLGRRMENAARLREFGMDESSSHTMDKFAGNGWLLVGDAAFSVDPIFSSGIINAFNSARCAAAVICEALEASDLSESAFASYELGMREASGYWQRLLSLFYAVGPGFIRVVSEDGHRVQALRLCEGDMFESSAAEYLDQLDRVFEPITRGPEVYEPSPSSSYPRGVVPRAVKA